MMGVTFMSFKNWFSNRHFYIGKRFYTPLFDNIFKTDLRKKKEYLYFRQKIDTLTDTLRKKKKRAKV